MSESTEKNYYLTTVKIKNIVEKDEETKTKNSKELYLVEGISLTDVEAKINKEFKDVTFEFEVSSVREIKIVKILK
jgi:hypothetical protein